MKTRVLSFALILLLILSTFALSACGGGSSQVPDAELQVLVDQFARDNNCSSSTWTATHRVEKDSHTDTVDLTVVLESQYAYRTFTNQIVYRYDRASDLWSPYGESGWSTPSLSFKESVKKSWPIDYLSTTGVFTVTGFSGNTVTFNYDLTQISTIHYITSSEDVSVNLQGSGSCTLISPQDAPDNLVEFYGYSDIPIPDGYKVISIGSHQKVDNLSLSVWFHVDEGFVETYISDDIIPVS